MKSKKSFLIPILLFVIIVLAWNLYTKTESKSNEIAKHKELEAYNKDPNGIKVFENQSATLPTRYGGVSIAVRRIYHGTGQVKCSFILPNQEVQEKNLELGEQIDYQISAYDNLKLRLIKINIDKSPYYTIFGLFDEHGDAFIPDSTYKKSRAWINKNNTPL